MKDFVRRDLTITQVMEVAKMNHARKPDPKVALYHLANIYSDVQQIIEDHLLNGGKTGNKYADLARCAEQIRIFEKNQKTTYLEPFNQVDSKGNYTVWPHMRLGYALRDMLQKRGVKFDPKTAKIIGVSAGASMPESLQGYETTMSVTSGKEATE